MKKYAVLLYCQLLFGIPESEDVRIQIHTPHGTGERTEAAQKIIEYILGTCPNVEITYSLSEKLESMLEEQPHLKDKIRLIEESSSSDSPDTDNMCEIKRMVSEVVSEYIKDKNNQTDQAVMQRELRDKQYRIEKYKFYAAAATAFTSVGALISSIVAQNIS